MKRKNARKLFCNNFINQPIFYPIIILVLLTTVCLLMKRQLMKKFMLSEAKFQISFKVCWQVCQHDPFFRETDYEPEIFLANEINFNLFKVWAVNFLNLGFVHQSNGCGGELERTWNRVCLQAISSTDNWMISVKPWLILKNNSYNEHNSHLAEYLGYGKVQLAYKYNK